MKQIELDAAIRRALNILDEWINITGAVERFSGYHGELESIVEDAVHCGAQAATGDYKELESEAE